MQPVRLHFQLTQAMGSRIELAYVASDAGSLKLVRQHRFGPHAIEKHLSPSGSDWSQFRSSLDQLGVWSWPSVCPNSAQIEDGIQWSVDIQFQDRAMRSSGDNCYPDQGGKVVPGTSPTPSFRQLIAALEVLARQSLEP